VRVYLDVSCLNRPFNDQSQDRIRLESEAVKLILARCATGEWQHVSSEMARIEIEANPDPDRRRRIRALLPDDAVIILNATPLFTRAARLESSGLKGADAMHVAAAEAQGADVLLTCDDRLIRAARRAQVTMRVTDPVTWLQEQQSAHDT